MAVINRPKVTVGSVFLLSLVGLSGCGRQESNAGSETTVSLSEAIKAGENLDRELKVVEARIEAKNLVLLHLVDDQTDLLHAASRWHAIDSENPHFDWSQFRLRHQGASDRERMCRSLIYCVGTNFVPVNSRAALRVKQLEAELRKLIEDGAFSNE